MQWLKDDRGKLNPRTEPILEAATKFFWSEEMQESLDSFCANYADLFADVEPPKPATGLGFLVPQPVQAAMPQGEQRLEWTQAHLEFQQLYEFRLEQFIAAQSFSAEEFVAACADALEHGSWANSRRMAEVVLSATTYANFVRMMSIAAAAKRVEDQARLAAEEEAAAVAAEEEEDVDTGVDLDQAGNYAERAMERLEEEERTRLAAEAEGGGVE